MLLHGYVYGQITSGNRISRTHAKAQASVREGGRVRVPVSLSESPLISVAVVPCKYSTSNAPYIMYGLVQKCRVATLRST